MNALENSFDLIINTVSADIELAPYVKLLKVDGALVLVGIPGKPFELNAGLIVPKRRSIAGSNTGGMAELQEMMDFCAEHDITSDVEVIAADYINAAYERTIASDVKYRFVIDASHVLNGPSTRFIDAAILAQLDPRVRAMLTHWPKDPATNVEDREDILANARRPKAKPQPTRDEIHGSRRPRGRRFLQGSHARQRSQFTSFPDGNPIKMHVTRRVDIAQHGRASITSTEARCRACRAFTVTISRGRGSWRRFGVTVVMVDFRNAVSPSSSPEVAPFPAGLHDCVSGLEWVSAHANDLGIDPRRIVVAGESGGGNLTLATGLLLKQRDRLHLVKGLYALCPYLNGHWPDDRYPSRQRPTTVSRFELHTNRGAMAYGIDAFLSSDPLAWPGFASVDDVRGLPPTVISVNECDPLRDEGIAFYRLLLAAGVKARGREVLGTSHATELYPVTCPEISRDTARDLATFALT